MKEPKIYASSAILLLLASTYAIYSMLETTFLERFYIFSPEQLHAISQSAIALHRNDTKALVATIVERLRAEDSIAPYLSIDEEWCFNNAGGVSE